MNQQTTLFSNEKLMAMIIPLFLEQLLIMLVGMADTLVVSYAGEAAVSGVSLVNQFNTIFIYLFTALASGGAVVISQYIGRKKNDDAGESASQLLSFSTIFSILIAGMVLIGNEGMLRLMFGKVEDSVMHACITYLRISAYSYPALAVYNAGAALFRSIGKTSLTMYLSVISNIINVIGNLIGVFVLRAGVAGVAYPSLIARTFSAVMITVLCFQRKNEVFYAVMPKFAILNPKFTFTLPKKQMVAGIYDIFNHICEQYFSGEDDNTSDYISEALMKSVIHSSRIAIQNPEDYEARSNIMWAATWALNTLVSRGKSTDWMVHMLGQAVGAYTDATHGMTLSAVSLPYYRYIMPYGLSKFCRFAVNVWEVDPAGKADEQVAREGLSCMEVWMKELGLTMNLHELGATEEMLQGIANGTLIMEGGYKVLNHDEVLEILKNSL